MLIAGVALCCGQTVAEPVPASEASEASLPARPLGATEPSQPAQPLGASEPSLSVPKSPSQLRYSADGLYNLANSYARAGKPGLAVLNYERAWLLAPNDPDINTNLEYIRASVRVPTEPRTRFVRVAQAVNPTLAAWIGVVGVALVGVGLLAGKLARRLKWLGAGGTLLGVALIALTVSHAMLLWPRMHEAVILINQTPARVSPVPMGDTAFVLREAETVTMAAEHEDFVLVRTRGGLSGWVARASLGSVVP
jgi:hypothetical protein